MFDSIAKHWLDPYLTYIAARLVRLGISANQLSLLGFCLALATGYSIWQQHFGCAIFFIIGNRLADGLDGFVARRARQDKNSRLLGGFIDISNDYVFYGLVPLAFAAAVPATNALPSSLLLFAFLMTAVSFLAAALVHEGLLTQKNAFQHSKSFFYSWGVMEGSETICFFIAACLFHQYYATMAVVVSIICFLTALLRFIALFIMLRKL